MAGPMRWDEYGEKCRANGNLALQVFVCVTTPVEPGPPPQDVMAKHKAYVAGLEVDGKVFLAGPLSNAEGTYMSGAGMIVLRTASLEEARALAEADPMHAAGVRSFTLQAWRLNEGAPLPGVRLSQRGFDMTI